MTKKIETVTQIELPKVAETGAIEKPLNERTLAELMVVIKRPGFTKEERRLAAKEVWARRSPEERKAVAGKAAITRAARISAMAAAAPVAAPATNGVDDSIANQLLKLIITMIAKDQIKLK